MEMLDRIKSVNMDADDVCWGLVDTLCWECTRCGLQLTCSCNTTCTEDYPLLVCGRCWSAGQKCHVMRPGARPADEEG